MGRVLDVQRDLPWLPTPNEVRTVLIEELPPLALVTSALALAFAGDRLLMTQLRRRGWDIPGGHIEPGELPEQTMRREVFEETGARLGPARLVAQQRIRLLGSAPAGYRYPCPESYQVFYCACVTALDPFSATEEACQRGLFAPEEARQLPWVKANKELYVAARGCVEHAGETPGLLMPENGRC